MEGHPSLWRRSLGVKSFGQYSIYRSEPHLTHPNLSDIARLGCVIVRTCMNAMPKTRLARRRFAKLARIHIVSSRQCQFEHHDCRRPWKGSQRDTRHERVLWTCSMADRRQKGRQFEHGRVFAKNPASHHVLWRRLNNSHHDSTNECLGYRIGLDSGDSACRHG